MLLKLRGRLDSFFVTVLLGLLIGAFAIWGIGPGMLSSSNQSIASVGSAEIPTNSYYSQVQNRAQQIQVQSGGQLSTPEIIRMLNLEERVLQEMIVTTAVGEHMSDLGMRAGSDLIRKALQGYEGFVLPDGSLSKEMIEQALSSSNISRSEFMDEVRRSVTLQHLLGSFGAGTAFSKEFADTLYTWQFERRRASLINIQASGLQVEEADEAALTEYFELNRADYREPERRTYSYLIITPALFTDKVEISDADIEELYRSRASSYSQPETRSLLQASFPSAAAAEAFVTAVTAGADFVEAATSVTSFTEAEINIGEMSTPDIKAEFGEEASAAILAAEENATTKPIAAFAGWNVFRVTSITPAVETPLADVRDSLKAELQEDDAVDLMYDFIANLEDELDQNPVLSIAAENLKLNLATVTGVDNRGMLADGKPAVTQQNEALILQAAFQQEAGAEPEVKELDPRDNAKGVYLTQVSEVIPSTEKPFEAVKNEVAARVRAERQQAKAGELAELARERLQNGENPEDLATELGGTSFDAKNIARTGDENSNLSANIRGLLFDLPVGGAGAERAADGNGYIVVRVTDVTPGDPASNKDAVTAQLADLNTGFKEELLGQYQSYLGQKYPAVVNRALQRQLFNADTAQ